MKPKHFETIIKKGYSLDMIYILSIINTPELEEMRKNSAKINNLYTTVIRKDLYSENTKELTVTGKSLIDFYSEKIDILKPSIYRKDGKVETPFERWWKTFPGTDTFTYKNKKFVGTRSLRTGKRDCEIKLNKILNEGEYTIDQLVKALEIEILQKKEASIKSGSNKMSFMRNSLTYLRNYTFESFIELIESNQQIVEKSNLGSVDI
jgi:hypothetical protein